SPPARASGLARLLGWAQLLGLGPVERLLRFLGRGLHRPGLDVTPHVLAVLSIGAAVAFTLVPGRPGFPHDSRASLRGDAACVVFDASSCFEQGGCQAIASIRTPRDRRIRGRRPDVSGPPRRSYQVVWPGSSSRPAGREPD